MPQTDRERAERLIVEAIKRNFARCEDDNCGHDECLCRDLAQLLKAEREAHAETRKALEFYADPETYFAIGIFPDPPCGEFATDTSDTGEFGHRHGKRAREALDALGRGDD